MYVYICHRMDRRKCNAFPLVMDQSKVEFDILKKTTLLKGSRSETAFSLTHPIYVGGFLCFKISTFFVKENIPDRISNKTEFFPAEFRIRCQIGSHSIFREKAFPVDFHSIHPNVYAVRVYCVYIMYNNSIRRKITIFSYSIFHIDSLKYRYALTLLL